MTKDKALKLALEALKNNRRTHNYCEDTWYSCPKHEDGCCNESAGDECNCGADRANAEIGKPITAIKEALAQPEQDREEMKIKSVTMRCKDYDVALPIIYNDFGRVLVGQPCIPPQRTWVGLTEEDKVLIKHDANFNQFMTAGEYADRVQQLTEARLKDKNT